MNDNAVREYLDAPLSFNENSIFRGSFHIEPIIGATVDLVDCVNTGAHSNLNEFNFS